MAQLSILAELLDKGQIKALKSYAKEVENFLEKCEEIGTNLHSIDSDYECILQVEYTGTGVELVCNTQERITQYIDCKFLRFGLKEGEKMPFYKFYALLNFCIADVNKEVDFSHYRIF